MPLPRWLARVNKRLFNKLEIKRTARPVLSHVGRTSGKTYHVPLDAHRVEGGFVFILMYGSDSDWVKNVLAAGTAQLRVAGDDVELTNPRLITKDVAWQLLPAGTRPPPGFLNVTEFLQMDVRR